MPIPPKSDRTITSQELYAPVNEFVSELLGKSGKEWLYTDSVLPDDKPDAITQAAPVVKPPVEEAAVEPVAPDILAAYKGQTYTPKHGPAAKQGAGVSLTDDDLAKWRAKKGDPNLSGRVWVNSVGSFTIDPNSPSGISAVAPDAFTATNPKDANFLQGFASRIGEVSAMEDGDTKLAEIAKLKATALEHVAAIRQDSLAKAEANFQVGDLRNVLLENEAADKADTNYGFYKSDSDITRKVRNDFQSAATAARLHADEYFKTHPDVLALDKLLAPLVNAEMRLTQKREYAAQSKDAKMQEMMEVIGNDAINLAAISFPKDDPTQMAIQHYKKKDFYEAAVRLNQPKELVDTAIEGNPFARQALIHRQAEAKVGSPADNPAKFQEEKLRAMKDMEVIDAISKSSDIYMRAYAEMRGETAAKELQSRLTTSVAMLGQAEANKVAAADRKAFALEYVADAHRKEFFGNVNTWSRSEILKNPQLEIGRIYEIAKNKKGTSELSVKDLLSEIMLLPKEQRAAPHEQLVRAAEDSARVASAGYFGGFSSSTNMRASLSIATTMTYMEKLKMLAAPIGSLGGVAPVPGGKEYLSSYNVGKPVREATENFLLGLFRDNKE